MKSMLPKLVSFLKSALLSAMFFSAGSQLGGWMWLAVAGIELGLMVIEMIVGDPPRDAE